MYLYSCRTCHVCIYYLYKMTFLGSRSVVLTMSQSYYKFWLIDFVSLHRGRIVLEAHLIFANIVPIIKYRSILKEMLNVTQLLGCVLWDLVAGESNCPLILGLPIYGETLMLYTVEFPTSNYKSIFKRIATFSFGKRLSSRYLLMLWYNLILGEASPRLWRPYVPHPLNLERNKVQVSLLICSMSSSTSQHVGHLYQKKVSSPLC